MARTKHNDFGEKIGGAKKDLWRERGLSVADLREMNDREADKYVKKDNIWKKPNYQAMLNDGIPLSVVYFIKRVRDHLMPKPKLSYSDDTPEKRLARQEQYVETVQQLKAVMQDVKTVDDAMKAYDRFFVANGYMREETRYSPTKKAMNNPVITRELASALHVLSRAWFEQVMTYKAEKLQLGVPKEDKVPAGYEICCHNGKYTFSNNNGWEPGTYFVTHGRYIVARNLESYAAALAWVKEKAKEQSKAGKQRFVPKQLAHIKREGPDIRRGRNITGQDYLDTFGFRGGEYGNWMNQKDRQASLNMGYEALKDLAAALHVSDKDIAFSGDLAIAFGARGSGGAVAHYEPLRKVINLTKMHGAGSLAHEWWHGFDDYLGGKMGVHGMLSENPAHYPLFQKLISTMQYRQETQEEAEERVRSDHQARVEKWTKSAEERLDNLMLDAVQKSEDKNALGEYEARKTLFLEGRSGSLEMLNELLIAIRGSGMSSGARLALEEWRDKLRSREQLPEIRRRSYKTDFFRNSQEMAQKYERDGGYWDSNVEMSARAFACYVMDKLPYRSDYLVGHAENAVGLSSDSDGKTCVIRAYPQGKEREAINAVFDEIIADLKLQHILTHEEVVQPQRSASELDASLVQHDVRFHEMPNGQLSIFDRPSVHDKLKKIAAKRPRSGPSARKPPDMERS